MINIWTMTVVTLPTALTIAALMAIFIRQRNINAQKRAVPVRAKQGAWVKNL